MSLSVFIEEWIFWIFWIKLLIQFWAAYKSETLLEDNGTLSILEDCPWYLELIKVLLISTPSLVVISYFSL